MNKVISINNLYKEYRLGVIGHGTLFKDLQSFWAKARGKEDPNSIIDVANSNKNKNKNKILAINNLTLDIEEGEVVGIIGSNGAGKSTLLKILSRVTLPTKGIVKVRGKIASLLEVGTGFHPELTGRENIYLNGTINGMSRTEINKQMDEIIDFAGVEKFADTPVKRYSSGMHVRLGFAVAAHLNQEILLIDEVLAVGDANFRKKAIDKINKISSGQGRTVLFVSHNMNSIKSLCNRAILLEKGQLKKSGKTSDIINEYYKNTENLKIDENSSLGESRFRRGNGKVRFSKIEILDENGRKNFTFEKGKKAIISFAFKAFEDVDDLICKVGFRSSDTGEVIAGYSTFNISNTRIKQGFLGKGKFTISTSNFMPNTFGILLWLGESRFQGVTDVVDRLTTPLIVSDKGETEKVGYFRPSVEFQLIS